MGENKKRPGAQRSAGPLDVQSGRLDLNQRPPAPEAGALPGYATPRRQTSTAHAPGGTRIPNLLIRSQMLYPIELRARSNTTAVSSLYRDRMRSKTDNNYRP